MFSMFVHAGLTNDTLLATNVLQRHLVAGVKSLISGDDCVK